MRTDKRKVVLIGTGMVGMSYAYSLLNQNVCDELVLVDVDRKKAEGEAMDLNHGLAFSASHMRIYAGDYEDCRDADIVVICAGVAQKEGESRLNLLKRNKEVFRSIVGPVTESGFNGLFLVATNPVDVMTRITYELSGFNPRRGAAPSPFSAPAFSSAFSTLRSCRPSLMASHTVLRMSSMLFDASSFAGIT